MSESELLLPLSTAIPRATSCSSCSSVNWFSDEMNKDRINVLINDMTLYTNDDEAWDVSLGSLTSSLLSNSKRSCEYNGLSIAYNDWYRESYMACCGNKK